MSSLLEQAIIDAKILKETARKNAESMILEEYSEELKKAVAVLLEQEEADATMPEVPSASMPEAASAIGMGDVSQQSKAVKNVMDSLQPAYLNEDGLQEIEIDLNSLVEKVSKLEEDMQESAMVSKIPTDTASVEEETLEEDKVSDAEKERNQAELAKAAAAERAAKADARLAAAEAENPSMSRPSEMSEEQEYTLGEELMMDMENVRDPDNTEIELNKQKKIAAALEAQKDELLATVEKKEEEKSELEEALDAAIAKLNETKNKLKKSIELNVQLKEGVQYLTEKFNESNLLNARLLYTNKTLGNSSLNERQKKQIAESISRASSVEEAKTIYSTLLKSTASVSEKRTAPQSLTEALNKSPSPFLPRSNKTQVDPTMDRWKILAGIKK